MRSDGSLVNTFLSSYYKTDGIFFGQMMRPFKMLENVSIKHFESLVNGL